MKINRLIIGLDVVSRSPGIDDVDVLRLTCDSRDVGEGALFVAVRGVLHDGHRYIADATRKKPAAFVLEDPRFLPPGILVPYIIVRDSRKALSLLADNFFHDPYRRIKCIGITGTNGKTTVSYLVKSILEAAGIKCGLIGTIGYKVEETNIDLLNTTPGVLELHELFSKMYEAGDACVAMEVSSHALDQNRVEGIVFKSAIFTNLTQDHLDYHKSMEDYFAAKKRLFTDFVDSKTDCVINQDDPFGCRLLQDAQGRVWSYGFGEAADIRIVSCELKETGSHAVIRTSQGDVSIATPLVGKHNLYNILAAFSLGVAQGLSLGLIKNGLERVSTVPGRLERVDSKKGFSVFVDYAHTNDALKNVLESLRAILHNGKIITVFGCGGDRDRGKRSLMGEVASRLSDFCFVTSDNPRSEDPQAIIASVVSGMRKNNFQVEIDRLTAIQKALSMAQSGDFVLVAGKGHEAYQIVKNQTLPFNDKAVVVKILSEI